jgi:hypothetical protein
MVVSNLSPEEQARDLLMYLNSSNLHYSAQVTPFSLYITVRKKFRKTSNFVIPVQASEPSMPSVTLDALKRDLENELKQSNLEFKELKVAKELLEERLEKVNDSNDDLKTELDDKTSESHELKVTNEMLQAKLQKTEADFTNYCRTVQEDKDTLAEKIEFLVASVKRSTEETLSMERKFTDAKKILKKNGQENSLLIQKLETLEQSNQKLKDENEKLKSNIVLSDDEISNQYSQPDSSSSSSSIESSTLHFATDSNHQPTNQKVPRGHSPSYLMARKPFPPSSATKDLLFFKPFLPSEVPENLFPPLQSIALGKPFAPSQDGNNNPAADETKKGEALNETLFVNVKDTTREAIRKSCF